MALVVYFPDTETRQKGPMTLVVYFPWQRDQTEGTNGSCRLLPLAQRPDRRDQWLLSFTSPATETRQKGPMALVVYFPWHRDQTEGTNGSCRLLHLAQRPDRRDQWLLSFTSPGTETRQKGPMALVVYFPDTETRQKGPMALVVYFPWHRDQTEGTSGSCRLLP